ncbi:hypothetical protein LTR17_013672 [Elasticomyces elasticus]|nr:hypothetical protein LTR17_013672 [Elasticomyces elasticus]
MSQHNAPYIPPPPPTPHSTGHAASQAPGDFYPHRRRPAPAQPSTLTTDLLRVQGGSSVSSTPVSGGNGTPFPFSPGTPVALHPRIPSALNPASHSGSPRTPNPAMEPYNPRQWSQSRQVSGSQMVFGRAGSATAPTGTRATTGMEESMPSPPPPYSPDLPSGARNASTASPVFEDGGFTASPLPAESARGSPMVPQSPAFPPPPSTQSSRHRERSASGLTGPRALLAGLRGKQSVAAEQRPSPAVLVPQFTDTNPPAARRAASTGHLQSSGSYTVLPPNASEHSSPINSWQPGMALPGPPPNPPTPGARSQSLNRFPTSSSTYSGPSERSFDSSRQRRTITASSLGTIPPTPAGWTEGQDLQAEFQAEIQMFSPYQPLRIDTGAHQEALATRRPPTRDLSAQGLRERRSLSRRGKDRGNDVLSPSSSDNSKTSENVFLPTEGAISRRREHTRKVSRYAGLAISAEPSVQPQNAFPARSTGRHQVPASVLTPPYTPAIKRSDSDLSGSAGLPLPAAIPSMRPVSHLLHTPNEDSSIPAPLVPSRPGSANSTKVSTRLDPFALQAIERHRAFVDKEATATSDEERLELFANFMVHESRLRRDRYQTAYNAMAGDIVDLTRDMWRSYTTSSKRAVTPSTSMSSLDPTIPSWASDGLPSSAHGGLPSSASSMGDFTPNTDAPSVADSQEAFDRADSRQWAETFKPTLSPIPSMAQSTVPDEESSRGRAPSRWWENSNSGSGSIGKPDRLEKSHRETKYMGLQASQLVESTEEPSPAFSRHSGDPGASMHSFGQDSGEYPPEKVGWHEGSDFDTPMATPARTADRKSSTASASSPLDISRLVTLPPPFPRHHPAVNNSHPSLTELRNQYRTLADQSDTRRIKDGFLDGDFAIRQQQQELAKERRIRLRSSVQAKIADGSISFTEAAKAEKDFDVEEAERGKANARGNFERYETNVAQPLNATLTDKITQADDCIARLQDDLEDRNQASDPNQAQEEGDAQPERLEKLTLLKWLFEAREQLHKEMFELHAERTEQYSEVILTPYRIQRAQAKIDEALAFFNKDSRTRQLTFAKDTQKRFEKLQSTMERNVSRGVEDQLSAFWDIAPNLLEVTSKVPYDLGTFDIQVPSTEYEENPSYNDFPLQYLYSLLSHAEKSAYQFIESQTNLLCLLHEVRTAASKSNLRLLEVECTPSTPGVTSPAGGFEAEVKQARKEAEERLTMDLKEKVGEVEGQWKEALGSGLEECKGRVKDYLEEIGGWEDGLET